MKQSGTCPEMKITLVLPELTSNPTGGGKIIYSYANELAARGHQVEIIHPSSLLLWRLKSGIFPRLYALLRNIARIGWDRVAVNPSSRPSWYELDRRVKTKLVPSLHQIFMPDADIVVGSLWRTMEYLANYEARKGRKFHFIQGYEIWSGPLDRVNQTLSLPVGKIVISTWLGDVVKQFTREPISYVPNPIDHQNFFLTKPIHLRKHRVSMLYSPKKWKGAVEGIAALSFAKTQMEDLTAVLFGLTPRPENLPEWIEYIQNPSVDELRDSIYNSSSVYLCPSKSEGWGLPITEAMACGCAIVSFDNGGARDLVVPGKNGALVNPNDQIAFECSLLQLLCDDEERIKFGHHSLEVAEKFHIRRSVDALEEAFEGGTCSLESF